ncbi:glycerol-3-phosphate transporter [Spirochaetia bacterium]|nr:glycerol-3-phosphate transporter [Spirochaetia bacterium]
MVVYFGRVNLSIVLTFLQNEYGYSKAALGIVAAGFFGTYAAGQLINGVLGDRFNPRYFVSLGLAASGLANIMFGVSRSLPAMFLFWSINGYFQSMLWGPMVRLVSEYSPPEKLHKGLIFLISSTIIGYFFSYAVLGQITVLIHWKWAFWAPGLLLLIMAFLWFWAFRGNTRKSAPVSGKSEDTAARGGLWGILDFLLRTRLWVVALVCVLEGLVKEGLTLWSPTILSESQSLGMDKALLIMTLLPLLNLPVLVLSGWVNKLFRHHEKPTLFFFLALSFVFAVMLKFTLRDTLLWMSIALFSLIAAAFAINNLLISFVPVNFQKEQRVSTAAGFLDCATYAGAAISGPLVGLLADRSGWKSVVDGWIMVTVMAIILTIFTRDYKTKKQ